MSMQGGMGVPAGGSWGTGWNGPGYGAGGNTGWNGAPAPAASSDPNALGTALANGSTALGAPPAAAAPAIPNYAPSSPGGGINFGALMQMIAGMGGGPASGSTTAPLDPTTLQAPVSPTGGVGTTGAPAAAPFKPFVPDPPAPPPSPFSSGYTSPYFGGRMAFDPKTGIIDKSVPDWGGTNINDYAQYTAQWAPGAYGGGGGMGGIPYHAPPAIQLPWNGTLS